MQIPPEGPHGRVKVTVEPVSESETYEPEDPNDPWYDEQLEKLLTPENLKGQGLTMGKILQSPEIGAWKHRTDIGDSVEFVEKMRRERQERLFKHG